MPSAPIHSLLTRRTIECLAPEQGRLLASEMEMLCQEYCCYPDMYYDNADKTKPFLCFIDDIPFHYIPNETVEYNNWKMEASENGPRLALIPAKENVHHRHCRSGFLYYFENIARSLTSDRAADAAKFIGALCHVLQDNTIPVHALEGFDGADLFVLDRIVAPPADDPYTVPSLVLKGELVEPELPDYQPRLLGASPQEASFHAYTRFADTVAANRLDILPLVSAYYAHEPAMMQSYWRRIYQRTLQLTCDFLHTGFAIGANAFSPAEMEWLHRVPLEKLRAARRPRYLSQPYQYTPFIDGWSLDIHRHPVPMSLIWEGEQREFQHGLGMGAHAHFAFDYQLPPNVFERLTGILGLHSRLGLDGRVLMRWFHDEKEVWRHEFSRSHPTAPFDLDVQDGGWWTLQGEALTEVALSPTNQLVLAEPVLIRSH